ncbi:T9SS type A sorting domain-containing protein [Flavobacterium sp. ABG]|uniref:DUF7619 domain-containing protein n=1 Tax=Flavobacterium sp. ABG TaxID=1423322 RepID=UPI00064AA946|nr:T9SS type A sorting domain-containing protein [Flavobacterium sp. ABG]KLT70392.1 internalin [Flavobacterium sp. ABG]
MKKNYLFFFALFIFLPTNAQNIEFKDENLKSKLLEADITNNIAKDLQGNFCKVDLNGDLEIQITEAQNISWLNISYYRIKNTTGINSFSNLEYLDLSINEILVSNFDALQKLKILICGGYIGDSIDLRPLINLEKLYCASTKLRSINLSGLKKLQFLDLKFNSLENLDLSGLSSLKEVYCSENYKGIIEGLDLKGLTGLEVLDCGATGIKYLKNLSDCKKLKKLYCESNKLETLDISGCESLEALISVYNPFETLNITGLNNLISLEVGGSKFSFLEANSLINVKYFTLIYSNVITLDLSNFVNLETALCNYNDSLTNIFTKNGVAEVLYFSACPSLKYICADENQFQGIKDEIQAYQYKDVHYNSYCSFGPGGVYSVIKGTTKIDLDKKDCNGNGEIFSNFKLNITDGFSKSTVITDNSGNYSLPIGMGTYRIEPSLENSNYFKVYPEFLTVSFPESQSPFIQNFCVTPDGNHQDIEITIVPLSVARPGFDAIYSVIYKNKGNKTVSGSVTLDFNDAILDYISATPMINNQVINKLEWNYENLKPFESKEITVVFNVNSPMETPAVNIDDRLSFNAVITPITDDEKPVDNSSALRQIVVGSYDPNDKTCLEGDVIKPELIGEYVHYLIRFENTGTYPAENVVVKDMIDLLKFDISTLVPTSASHAYTTKISAGNKVEFIFEKINLPFDDANNDGYITFKIKTLPSLSVGDSFTNEANIYFDYNFPILTNKTNSTFKTLGVQDFKFSKHFNIYPVPAKDLLNINSKNNIEIISIAIYDTVGKLVIVVPNANLISNIDVSKLESGNYILRIKTDKGTTATKFIKK